MKNLMLDKDERKRMLEFTEKAMGAADEKWTDRELMVNYNKALALLVLMTSEKVKG